MIETGDTMDVFYELGMVGRVGAVGVGADRVRRCGQFPVRNESAVFCLPIHTRFDIIDLGDGTVVKVYHVATDVARSGFLTEKIATAWNAVSKG